MYLKVKYKVPIKIATIITEIINIVANAIKLLIKISNYYSSFISISVAFIMGTIITSANLFSVIVYVRIVPVASALIAIIIVKIVHTVPPKTRYLPSCAAYQ